MSGITTSRESLSSSSMAARASVWSYSRTLAMRMRLWSVGRVFSLVARTSSYSFSPGRRPLYSIMMSSSGMKPARRIMRRARSSILTDSPMSKTKIWFPVLMVAASITRRQASGMVMKKRVISG